MLRCKRTYRNAALGLFVEAGEVLRDISPDLEAWLQRDCPDAWEVISEKQAAKAPDAPPQHKMVTRERAVRKETERIREDVMTSRNMPGLARPKQ